MIVVFAINQRLAQKTMSSSLKSAAKDNLSDGLVSMGTAIGLYLLNLVYLLSMLF